MSDDAPQRFAGRLAGSLADGSFVRLLLGRPHDADPSLLKLLARRVVLRGEDHLSLVWRHRSKDITKNLPLAAALDEVGRLVQTQFHHAHLVTTRHDVQLLLDRKGRWALRVGRLATQAAAEAPPTTAPASATSGSGVEADGMAEAQALPVAPDTPRPPETINRQRQHLLGLETPFLAELGVTDHQHRLVPAMARKWRQINKFVEVLAHAVAQSPLAGQAPGQPVRVLDFGAGKGYLTFAVHHQLRAMGHAPEVVGVELRADMTALCNQAVARLGLQGLRFDTGDVRLHQAGPPGSTDIMIALHACDTATDLAMHRGVQAGAAIILCSPCCHKELRPQLQAPPGMQGLLRHGIHRSEQAEMLTDALRALLLEASGYDAQVFEFISPEHTSKNKMVLAVRRARPLPEARVRALWQEVAALKTMFGIRQQTLESLLAAQPGIVLPPLDGHEPALQSL